jgi:HEAT repeat protein
MSMSALDERLALAYLVNSEQHVRRWREAGGPWQPFDGEVPVAAMKAAALGHPSAKVRREALGVLDHAANDESTEVFRAALSDLVPRVRLVALHGLSCERCRVGAICVDDVVLDVVAVLRDDVNVKVRHAAIDVLCRFASRDDRVVAALRTAAAEDPDPLVRAAAGGAARGEHRIWSRKAVRRRHRTSARRARTVRGVPDNRRAAMHVRVL